jgi:hypothetical protein
MLGNILEWGSRNMGANLPRISEQWIYGSEVPSGCIQLDSAAWFGWLAAETTRRFSYPLFDRQLGYIAGWMTVRKERRQRGREYWVAYRRLRGQVRKVYLGHSEAVTTERLHTVGWRLQGKEEADNEQASK